MHKVNPGFKITTLCSNMYDGLGNPRIISGISVFINKPGLKLCAGVL